MIIFPSRLCRSQALLTNVICLFLVTAVHVYFNSDVASADDEPYREFTSNTVSQSQVAKLDALPDDPMERIATFKTAARAGAAGQLFAAIGLARGTDIDQAFRKELATKLYDSDSEPVRELASIVLSELKSSKKEWRQDKSEILRSLFVLNTVDRDAFEEMSWDESSLVRSIVARRIPACEENAKLTGVMRRLLCDHDALVRSSVLASASILDGADYAAVCQSLISDDRLFESIENNVAADSEDLQAGKPVRATWPRMFILREVTHKACCRSPFFHDRYFRFLLVEPPTIGYYATLVALVNSEEAPPIIRAAIKSRHINPRLKRQLESAIESWDADRK